MAEYIVTNNGDTIAVRTIGVSFPLETRVADIIQDIEKMQLKVNKRIKFSNKKNWINSNKRRK